MLDGHLLRGDLIRGLQLTTGDLGGRKDDPGDKLVAVLRPHRLNVLLGYRGEFLSDARELLLRVVLEDRRATLDEALLILPRPSLGAHRVLAHHELAVEVEVLEGEGVGEEGRLRGDEGPGPDEGLDVDTTGKWLISESKTHSGSNMICLLRLCKTLSTMACRL